MGACGDDSTAGSTTSSTSTTGPGTTSVADTSGSTGLDDTGTSDEGSSDDAAVPQCPVTHTCVPAPSDDWEGPVVLLESATEDDEPTCEGSYPELAAVGYQGLVAPPAECSCACGEAEGASCSTSVIARYWGEDSTCNSVTPAQYEFTSVVCNSLPSILPAGTYWSVQPVPAGGGSCEPIVDASIDPAEFEQRLTACGGVQILEGCAVDQACVPRPGDALPDRVCVWREGEHECPSGYDERHLVHTDVDDDRGCAECTCGDPVGLCNDAELRLTQNPCSIPYAAIMPADGHCRVTGFQARSALFSPGVPTAFCSPSEAVTTGTAEASGAITFCCR